MENKMMHAMIVAVAATTGAIALTGGVAAAFEPPADPTDNFTCDGGPVAGHPGHRGLMVAMGKSSSGTAWAATSEDGPVTTC